jgi:hypothetical protein
MIFLKVLEDLNRITGLSLNSNLYSKSEKQALEDPEEEEGGINSDDLREIDRLSHSTGEDKSPRR